MGDVMRAVWCVCVAVVLAACGDNLHPKETPVAAFGFLAAHNPGLSSDVTATITATSINATFPFGADVTALAASFEVPEGTVVTVDGVVQVSGTTRNDFSATAGGARIGHPIVYVFTSADGTAVSYSTAVTLAAASDHALTAFSFSSAHNPGLSTDVAAAINGTTITATVPFGTDVSALVATFTTTGTSVAIGATPQNSNTSANNYSTPLTYVVTAADASTQSFVVTVTVASSSAKELTSFAFLAAHNSGLVDVTATVSGTAITATVPFGTDVTALVPTFATTGMIVTIGGTPQISGVTANNFTTAQTYVVTAADTTTKSFVVTVVIASNTAKNISTFAFLSSHNAGLAADVTATITGTAITATVPFGTNVSALVATFASSGASIAVGVTPQVSNVTPNNFTAPTTYVVTAADASTKSFVVTVLIASNTAKDLSTFAFRAADNAGLSADVIASFSGTTVTATVPFGTNVSALVASFTTSGASVAVGGVPQTSGVTANNFTTAKSYVVTAGDTSTKSYTVTVAIASSTAKDITTFSFLTIHNPGLAADVTATVNGTAITATVPFGTDVSALIATFATTGATVMVGGTQQTSGVTANSFAAAATYLVTATDASTKSYIVTVGIAPSGGKDLSTFSFLSSANSGLGADVIATVSGTSITATVPFGTNVTALIATFSTTGASVAIAGTAQTSGVTPNSFASSLIYTVTASDSSTKSYTVTVTSAQSGAKDLTTFKFMSSANSGLGADVSAAISGTTITATVPFGTNVSALIATFSTTGASVAVGGVPQTSGISPNSFATPVSYVVTAADSSTTTYTVTVTSAPSGAKDLTSFTFLSALNTGIGADVVASISGTAITATVPFGTDVTALVASFGTSGTIVDVGATVQTSGVTANDFTSAVTYVVRAADTSTKSYTVTVTAAQSSAKDLTSFKFLSAGNSGLGADVVAVISGTSITAVVPFGTDLTALVATFGTSGASVAVAATPQTSGVTSNDFTTSVSYVVRASDASTKSYTVTVTAASSSAKDLTSFKFLSATNSGLGADVIAGISGTSITAVVPFGTDLTALVATFGTSGASVSIGGAPQTSGVTANSFVTSVSYAVTASDLTVKSYTVTVTAAPSGAKDLTSFKFLSATNSSLGADIVAGISGTTITATVPFGTDLTALVATFGTSGTSVAVAGTPQINSVTANNFTSSVTYDVTASDLTIKSYTVTVTAAPSGAKDLTSFKFLSATNSGLGADVVAGISGTSITAVVPFGTDLSALVATFGTTGTTVGIAGNPQTSGVTANSFATSVTYDVTASDLSIKSYTVTVTVAQSSANDLSSFKFLSATNTGLGADVVAGISGTSVTAVVPFGTDLTALVATFGTTGASVAIAGTPQTSGGTANDFTSAVTYDVSASDLSVKSYTVTVTAAQNSAKDLVTFKFLSSANSGLGADVVAGISGTSITATVPFGVDVSSLIPTFGTTGASVTIAGVPQVSDVTANDFNVSVTYLVTAADASTKSYTVTVNVASNSAKDIGAFAFRTSLNSGLGADVVASITGTSITATVPYGTDVSALIATFGSTGSAVTIGGAPQVSAVTANNFTSVLTYLVTAADASTKSYTVTITVALDSAKDIGSFAFLSSLNSGLGADVGASVIGTSITATVPYGTDVSALIPTFATTGASVIVAGTVQISGVTANSFASTQSYLVTAADTSTKSYSVTVTVALDSAKDIGSFAFLSGTNSGLGADVVATITGTSITATVPFGTDASILIPTFGTTGSTVTVGAIAQTSGVTPNDFTSSVGYLVTAADATTKSYTVTVTVALSSTKDIGSFQFLSSVNSGLGVDVTATITGTSITAIVPFGTAISSLKPTFGTTGTVTVAGTPQVSGVTANDFTSSPTYLVTAADASTKSYSVTVTVALDAAKDIQSFAFLTSLNSGLASDIFATISSGSITVSVPSGLDVSALIATFTTNGASVTVNSATQVSGTTANDFTNPVTYVVTAADASVQPYTVTVTAAGAHSGVYYVNPLFSHATNAIIGITTSGTDVYFLDQTSSSSFAVEKIDATGTTTTIAMTSTAVWKDIIVVGGYLFISQSVTAGATTYSVVRYQLANLANTSTLTLPGLGKRFASDGAGTVYLLGNVTARGIMYFDAGTFATVNLARTAIVYVGLTYRSVVVTGIAYRYLYATHGGGGGGGIDEIDADSLSQAAPPSYSTIACPSEVITPNVIKWIGPTQSFVVSDSSSNGGLGATTNGEIYSYTPTFDSTTGNLIGMGAGSLVIRGNSNSGAGYMETPFATSLPSATDSTDPSVYLYQAAAIAYNITADGYVNLFAGNGSTASGTGSLIKFYDAGAGTSTGGQ